MKPILYVEEGSAEIVLHKGVNVPGGSTGKNRNWGTHFPYTDGINYVRGKTKVRDDLLLEDKLCFQNESGGNTCITKSDAGWVKSSQATLRNHGTNLGTLNSHVHALRHNAHHETRCRHKAGGWHDGAGKNLEFIDRQKVSCGAHEYMKSIGWQRSTTDRNKLRTVVTCCRSKH